MIIHESVVKDQVVTGQKSTSTTAKSTEFRERGGEVYLPADVVRADASAEAEETVAVD